VKALGRTVKETNGDENWPAKITRKRKNVSWQQLTIVPGGEKINLFDKIPTTAPPEQNPCEKNF